MSSYINKLPVAFRNTKDSFFKDYLQIFEQLLSGESRTHSKELLFYLHPKRDENIISLLQQSTTSLLALDLLLDKLKLNGHKLGKNLTTEAVDEQVLWRIIDKNSGKVYAIKKQKQTSIQYSVYRYPDSFQFLFSTSQLSWYITEKALKKIFKENNVLWDQSQVMSDEIFVRDNNNSSLYKISKNSMYDVEAVGLTENGEIQLRYLFSLKEIDGKFLQNLSRSNEKNNYSLSKDLLIISRKQRRKNDYGEYEILYSELSGKVSIYLQKQISGVHELLDISTDLFHPRLSFLFGDRPHEYMPDFPINKLDLFQIFLQSSEWFENFLQWMAKWLALSLKEDWNINQKRKVIATIMPIFRTRGTLKGLKKYLEIYTEGKVLFKKINTFTLYDNKDKDKSALAPKIGEGTILGSREATSHSYYFVVDKPMIFESRTEGVENKVASIVDSETPLHIEQLLVCTNIPVFLGAEDDYHKILGSLQEKGKILRSLDDKNFRLKVIIEEIEKGVKAKKTYYIVKKANGYELYQLR
ncbi:phage tail protein [Candidatus Uabimicrobium sp. HlEnr_7]|uniref:phage tail protein n=1 Tax=Candidatus Uabimicrobium helgolandensis TaxID=3095367 RepID=UPI0035592D9E